MIRENIVFVKGERKRTVLKLKQNNLAILKVVSKKLLSNLFLDRGCNGRDETLIYNQFWLKYTEKYVMFSGP